MRKDVIDDVEGKLDYTETGDLKGILPELDILYATRIQKERFTDSVEYEKIKEERGRR